MKVINMKVRPLLVTAVLCLAGLAGCTSGHDLPTISTPPSSPTVNLEAVAKSYYDCMMDAGIDVELTANTQGALTVVSFKHNHFIEWQIPDGGSGMSMPTDNPQDSVTWSMDASQHRGEYYLSIDGVDRSDDFATCLKESGYNDNEASGPIVVDPEQIAQAVTVANTWTACARENGWPDIADIAVPDSIDDVAVHIPASITEDQLRQLLDACPNFDPDPLGLGPNASYGEGIQVPNVRFDDQTGTEVDHVNKLQDIWYEAMNAYYAEH